MCKAPKTPAPQEPKKPMFLRNKYLDEFVGDSAAVKTLKSGRASLRIPLGGTPATPANTVPRSVTPDPNMPPDNGDFRGIAPRRPGRARFQTR